MDEDTTRLELRLNGIRNEIGTTLDALAYQADLSARLPDYLDAALTKLRSLRDRERA